MISLESLRCRYTFARGRQIFKLASQARRLVLHALSRDCSFTGGGARARARIRQTINRCSRSLPEECIIPLPSPPSPPSRMRPRIVYAAELRVSRRSIDSSPSPRPRRGSSSRCGAPVLKRSPISPCNVTRYEKANNEIKGRIIVPATRQIMSTADKQRVFRAFKNGREKRRGCS